MMAMRSCLAVWQLKVVSGDPSCFLFPDRDWEPFSNWHTSERRQAEAELMFDDDVKAELPEIDELSDEETEVAYEWAKASTSLLKPCPQEPLRSIKPGDAIVVWFGGEFNGWYEGKVTRITPRNKLPVRAMFADGEASFDVVKTLYGVTGGRKWALLQEMTSDADLEPVLPASAAAEDSVFS